MPSSMNTLGAPISGGLGPVVLRLTTSLSVPGSLPWHVFMHEPTVMTGAPLTLVRIAGSIDPSDTLPTNGYGIGSGLGAAGVVQTLTAMPTH
ncbi:MAG: hypothetical protein MUF34_37640 [Polyangiaceae bacterium]|nr:hypothetical protein [Polyangiaceae bacterium]